MGMYTELHFDAELKQLTDQDVIDILEFMTGKESRKPNCIPDHPLFNTDRWEFMLGSDSYYFSSNTSSTIILDSISDTYFLNIKCNLKNYDHEIEKFINWISKYIDPSEHFLGFMRYEKDIEPTLIYRQEY